MSHPAMRIDLLDKILEQVELNPETYRQNVFVNACGTAYCIAGWAYINKREEDGKTRAEAAYEMLKMVSSVDIVKTAVSYLEMKREHGLSPYHPVTDFPDDLFDEELSLENIIEERNRLAALQGLPAYVRRVIK